MNHRLTLAAASAVVLASFSEFALINGGAWLVCATGAVIAVALAGTLTRVSSVPAAAGATLLAAVAAFPLFAAPSPYWKATAVIIVAICAASASRLRLLPVFAGLVTYLAALLLYLNALRAGPQSLARIVPTAASLRHLLMLAHQGALLTKSAPPVAGTHGVQLLAAASIGLAAIAADFFAVRLHRPAIAGLPLLVLFMARIATTAKVGGLEGLVTFFFAAAGYLALLTSEGRDRLRGWGRVVTVWHYADEDERLGGADVGALAATGRRIGLAAMSVAVIAPLLLPTLNVHRLFTSGSGGGGPAHTVSLPIPLDQLHGLLTRSAVEPVLSYRSPLADPSEQYLQVYVLNYDPSSSNWSLIQPAASSSIGNQLLPSAAGVTASTPEITSRTVITFGHVTSGYNSRLFFLPAPYAPLRLRIPGSWRQAAGTLMIYSGGTVPAGLQYAVTSREVNPTAAMLSVPQQIPAAISESYLGFASPQTSQLQQIAAKITRGKTTAYAKAVALESWFRSDRFTYSLQANIPNNAAGLLSFLTTDRQGFCQQFAFAMAVLARLVGIPSRVAIGYTAGNPGTGKTWQVTTADAHAWPELYFSGVGWIRFEPTPGGIYGQGTAVEPAYVTSTSRVSSTAPGGATSGGGPSTAPSPRVSAPHIPHVQEPSSDSLAPSAPPARNGSELLLAGIAALLLLAAMAPGTARLVLRRRRWHAATTDSGLAQAAWLEICADLEDFGLPYRRSESPRAVARRVCAATLGDDAAQQAVGRITTAVERARYAAAPDAAGPIRTDVALVRRALARSAGRSARWRARLLPASTLGPARTVLRDALGLLTGWMPSTREPAAGRG